MGHGRTISQGSVTIYMNVLQGGSYEIFPSTCELSRRLFWALLCYNANVTFPSDTCHVAAPSQRGLKVN